MKTLLTLILVLGLVACDSKGPKPTRWTMQNRAMTPADHARLDAHVKEVLSHVPQTLQGHDQDLDDYAATVYREATKALTPPRMFEEVEIHDSIWYETGKWRECTQEELKAAK